MLVDEEQVVKAGDVLVRIDPRDYQVAVEKAEADLADAEATLASSTTDVPILQRTPAARSHRRVPCVRTPLPD